MQALIAARKSYEGELFPMRKHGYSCPGSAIERHADFWERRAAGRCGFPGQTSPMVGTTTDVRVPHPSLVLRRAGSTNARTTSFCFPTLGKERKG